MSKEILNLGCGFRQNTDAINIDINETTNPDMIVDLESGKLPFEDNTFKEVYAYHILEHIKNLIPLMNEIYRVMKTKGKLFIKVPQNEGIWSDPTHVRGFSRFSWRYYCSYPRSELSGIKTHFKEISNEFIYNEDGGELQVVLEK